MSLSDGGDRAQGVVAAQHPELSPHAAHALRRPFTSTHR